MTDTMMQSDALHVFVTPYTFLNANDTTMNNVEDMLL